MPANGCMWCGCDTVGLSFTVMPHTCTIQQLNSKRGGTWTSLSFSFLNSAQEDRFRGYAVLLDESS